MRVTEDPKISEATETEDILDALVLLGGAALECGNKRLYEHIMRAKLIYEKEARLEETGQAPPLRM